MKLKKTLVIGLYDVLNGADYVLSK